MSGVDTRAELRKAARRFARAAMRGDRDALDQARADLLAAQLAHYSTKAAA